MRLVAETQVDGLDALGLQAVAQLDLRAEERPVRLHGRVEILDREGDVVHGAHVHATDPNDWSLVGGGNGARRPDALGGVRLGLHVRRGAFPAPAG